GFTMAIEFVVLAIGVADDESARGFPFSTRKARSSFRSTSATYMNRPLASRTAVCGPAVIDEKDTTQGRLDASRLLERAGFFIHSVCDDRLLALGDQHVM